MYVVNTVKPVLSGFSSHIYIKLILHCKIKLYSANTSIKRTRTPKWSTDLSSKTCIKRTLQDILQWIFVMLLEESAV